MASLIRACFAFWYGTILAYSFSGVKINRKTVFNMWLFFILTSVLQIASGSLETTVLAERLYPLTTHLPLILWLIFIHKVKWEISVGSVITAYLCCELPNWVSQFGAIPFGSNYTAQVIIYCFTNPLILLVLLKKLVPSIQSLFAKSMHYCLSFTAIPFVYYLWCYSTTVYSSYLKQYGYEVAFTMSALFTLLFMIFAIAQNKRQEDVALMKELEQARQEAILANRAKGDFLASMSHEIRTPINAVLGLDEMILRESTDSQILDYANKIKSSGQSLLYLINDILDLSKIESNKMELTPSEYNPKQLFSEVLLMIEPRVNAKGLVLSCNIDPHIPAKLYGDDMRIRQILINLLTNAVKYTNEGKITFTAQLLQKNAEHARIYFSVRDTGIGIKEEDRTLLFESFRRLDTTQTKNIEGTGLGLNITQKLLRLMDSDLCLQSIYEIGSDFNFTLTQKIIDSTGLGVFQPGIQQPLVTATYRESFFAPDANILVADDNDMNLVVFRGLLKNSGMKIKTVLSGNEALSALQNESFDLVFLDHLMPAMDGIETLHKILENRQLREHAGAIVALTANAIAGAREFYIAEGFTDYLTKPVQGHILEEMILKYLPKKLIQPSTILEPSVVEEPEKPLSDSTEPILNQKLGLSFCTGDKNFYYEVLDAFLQSNFISTLNDHFNQQDWKNYKISIHGIKSAAKSIGAISLSELAKDMELALKERNDINYIITNHPIVLEKLKIVEQEIRELIKK